MAAHEDTTIKDAVRDRYAGHARTKTSCCGSGCGCSAPGESPSVALDYTAEDLAAIPADADLGLGCGNPLAFDDIRAGETVLDLGSGGGIDCFIAARRTGPTGRVIGVDMTPDMIALAALNAARGGFDNVEFRLGEIEALPVADGEADLVISNCVINLVPDKRRAFAETFRALSPGGRISVSDIVTTEELPEVARESVAAYVACLGGALTLDDYLGAIADAGFENVRVVSKSAYAMDDDEAEAMLAAVSEDIPAELSREEAIRIARLFLSVTVQATRPGPTQ